MGAVGSAPAGGIKPGESPDAAILREVTEETGLEGLRIVRYLGEDLYDLRPYMEVMCRRHFFHLEPVHACPEEWEHWELGSDDETRGDGGVLLRHYWLPLRQCHSLSGGLGAFLGPLSESFEESLA